MTESQHILYENPEHGICRIWLNRPQAANAQSTKFLSDLNDAFDRAIEDETVKVIILAARGKHFSAGHDLMEADITTEGNSKGETSSWSSKDWEGAEAHYCREKEFYEGYCRRWRDLSKPTIVAVQGKVIAGGLMLVWPFDFVIASEDATFQDNTLFMGIPGVEYFAHVWELGIRKAKEFLLTGQPVSAQYACDAGMVNRVVKADDLQEETLAFARLLTNKPGFALKLGKDVINTAFDSMGFEQVQKAAFNAHHLAHAHYRIINPDGVPLDKSFFEGGFTGKKKKPE